MTANGAPSVPARAKRGRPVVLPRDVPLAEVAEALAFDLTALERLLARAPGSLPGAERVDGRWSVPERDLLRWLGSKTLDQRVTVKDVAESLRVSVPTVYRWLELRDPVSKRALLPSHAVLGHVRIFARDVLALPAQWPEWAPARPSSFSQKSEEVAA